MRPEASVVVRMTLTVVVGELKRCGKILVRLARAFSKEELASLAQELVATHVDVVDWESDLPEGQARLCSFTVDKVTGTPDSRLILEFERDPDGIWAIGA